MPDPRDLFRETLANEYYNQRGQHHPIIARIPRAVFAGTDLDAFFHQLASEIGLDNRPKIVRSVSGLADAFSEEDVGFIAMIRNGERVLRRIEEIFRKPFYLQHFFVIVLTEDPLPLVPAEFRDRFHREFRILDW